jgi:hypothetical protein
VGCVEAALALKIEKKTIWYQYVRNWTSIHVPTLYSNFVSESLTVNSHVLFNVISPDVPFHGTLQPVMRIRIR